jgi:hypothetical protein
VEPRYLTLQEFQNWITKEHFNVNFENPKHVVVLCQNERILNFLDSDFLNSEFFSFEIYTLHSCPRIFNASALIILGETCLQQEWELYEIISTLTPRLPICLCKETQQTQESESHFMRY